LLIWILYFRIFV